MSDIQTSTVSEDGFACTSQVGDFDLQIDATDETGPNPNAALVATYASCFLPAFRVGGQKTGFDDLGKVQIDADADLDDGDDLTSISFDVYVESDLSDDEFAEITELAEDICHVHDALRDELQADVTVVGDAF
ncbi:MULTISPECIES: OsmC family protein [Haloferax]|uniref:OsmC-like protein superfamily protein n=3 Tax=Haloferax TaxID=2251 RepID=M0I9D8_HALVO|nr:MULTISPECIES: OsmC family protein [Haloferax]ELK54734.1 OsmC-like protein superfamily protein [Haloferax sp. BAB-2207]ELZ93411.1 OsmC-like protein superfamily protein [Haloferax alexandrinus JCM 10717]MCO8266580.1 OsmC family protein [Haloferax sp. AB510]QIB78382.1 OsmC family protein [Haloferax alexandrinus]CQR50218.1 OsmC-like protein [Haloferax massiliensis]